MNDQIDSPEASEAPRPSIPLQIGSFDRQLLEGMPVACYTCDKDGYISYFNESAAELWGRRPEIGKDKWCGSWRIYEPDGVTQMSLDVCPMGLALKKGEPIFGEEIIIERPDHTRRNVLPHPKPIFNEQGEVIGAYNVLIDITERKTAERQVIESEKRFRTISETAPVMTWLSGITPERTFFNKGWTDFTGRTLDEELGFGWLESIYPDQRESIRNIYVECFTERKIYRAEYQMKRHDGEYRWLSAIGNPRYTLTGEFLGYSGSCTDITEQKEANSELERIITERTSELVRKNEELLQQRDFVNTIIDASIDPIFVFNSNMQILALNSIIVRGLQLDKNDIVGKNVLDIIPELKGTEAYTKMQEALLGNKAYNLVFDSPSTGRSFEYHLVPLKNNNVVYACLAMAHDTTPMIEMAQQLRESNKLLEEKNAKLIESEERYKQMIQEVEDYAIIGLDKDGIIRNWNEGAEKIKGYSEEEVLGKHFSIFYKKEEQEAHLPEQILQEAILNDRVAHEGWRVRKDGSLFWGSVVLTTLHNYANEVIGFSKVTRDLTVKKLAEDALRASADELKHKNDQLLQQKEFAEAMLDSSVDLISVYDTDERFISMNKRTTDLLGIKEEDIIGKKYTDAFPKSKDSIPHHYIKDGLKGIPGHFFIHKAIYTDRSFEVFTIPLRHNDQVYAVMLISHDITDLLEANEKIKEAYQELESKNDELKRSNSELEQFAHIASHDLQEPLRKIQMFTSRMQESASAYDPQTRSYLDKILNSSQRMSKLIKDVLDYSSLNPTTEQFVKTDLNKVFEETVEDFDLIIDEKKAKIKHGILPTLNANPLQMSQLFHNLLGNSLKFSNGYPAPRIQVTAKAATTEEIKAHSLNPALTYSKISFKDNGIGFDKQYAEKIFVVFQRLHGKQEYQGTGIGLALCRKIVDIHGGAIYAESELGKGATFHILLPLDKQ